MRGVAAVASSTMLAAMLAGCSSTTSSIAPVPPSGSGSSSSSQLAKFRQKINHIVIVYQENWGFDSLYGKFPGANGYANATSITTQVDVNGKPIATDGPVLNGGAPDPNFAAFKPTAVAPFDLTGFISTTQMTGDPNHNFYLQQAQIDGGKMDKYLAYPSSNQGGLSFGYFDTTNMPEGKLAQQYVLADNFHQDAFGGSFLNNMYAACECAPQQPLSTIPPALIEKYDVNGNPVAFGGSEGRATNDGYIVNTSYSTQYPQLNGATVPTNTIVTPLTNPTLGDRLSAANVSWKFYSGGLANALKGTPDPTFQAHHQSYLYFKNYAPNTPGAAHIVDFDASFQSDLASGTLPSVSWVKPLGAFNEHPGYANIAQGQMFVANLVSQIQMSPIWNDTMIVIFYDEAGGHYDHAAPLPVDRFGPSTRVPAIFISPYLKRGVIDHTNYQVASILATIEQRFGLAPLTNRDAAATPILAPFDFSQPIRTAALRQSLGPIPAAAAAPMPPHYRGHPVTELDLDD